MTPEAERVHARLLRYTVEDHRADRGWLAMAAAKLILEQVEEIESLKAALAAKAEQSQPAPKWRRRKAPATSSESTGNKPAMVTEGFAGVP